jgi:hypothetical protein
MGIWSRELMVRQIHLGQVKLGDWIKGAILKMREKKTMFEKLIQEAAAARLEISIDEVLKRLDVGPIV